VDETRLHGVPAITGTRFTLKARKTPVEVFPLLRSDWHICTLWSDAVPQVLNKLKPLGQW
jgi:hypothetical protein